MVVAVTWLRPLITASLESNLGLWSRGGPGHPTSHFSTPGRAANPQAWHLLIDFILLLKPFAGARSVSNDSG